MILLNQLELEGDQKRCIFMTSSIARSSCRSSEMPQAFRYSYISEAYSKVLGGPLNRHCHDMFVSQFRSQIIPLRKKHSSLQASHVLFLKEKAFKVLRKYIFVTHKKSIQTIEFDRLLSRKLANFFCRFLVVTESHLI